MKTHVKLAKISKKTAAFIAAATTLFAGLSISSAAPQQASAATRDRGVSKRNWSTDIL